MLIYAFYNVIVKEIESLLAKGRRARARRRYGDLRRQLGEGELSLLETDIAALPLSVRSMIWYCVREFIGDKEQLFASAEAQPRIAGIIRTLGMNVRAEMRFFNQVILDLEILVNSIDLGTLPESAAGHGGSDQ